MTQMAGERNVRELGTLPPDGLPVIRKREFKVGSVIALKNDAENEEMKFRRMTLVAALSAATTMGACASQTQRDAQLDASVNELKSVGDQSVGDQKEPRYSKTFDRCMDAANGVTVDVMNCMDEELDYQDNRLNSVYQRLRKVLTPTNWDVLRKEQRKWLAGRDSCEVNDDIRGGTAEMLVRENCVLRKTTFRAVELETLFKQQRH